MYTGTINMGLFSSWEKQIMRNRNENQLKTERITYRVSSLSIGGIAKLWKSLVLFGACVLYTVCVYSLIPLNSILL